MSERAYIGWSLLAAAACALALVAAERFGNHALQPLFARRRRWLAARADDEAAQGNRMAAGTLDDAVARLDAFVARRPRLVRALTAIDRVNWIVAALAIGFVLVGLWAGRVGGAGQWPATIALAPLFVGGVLLESIPPVDGAARLNLFFAALIAAFAIPLAIGIGTSPR